MNPKAIRPIANSSYYIQDKSIIEKTICRGYDWATTDYIPGFVREPYFVFDTDWTSTVRGRNCYGLSTHTV